MYVLDNLTFKDIDKNDIAEFTKFKNLYIKSFPKHERLSLKRIMKSCKKDNIKLKTIYSNNEFIGFVYYVFYNNYAYIWYLSVSENNRNKGYGSLILNNLKEEFTNKTIFLLIEEINDKYKDNIQREKRLNFYEKNNFNLNDFLVKEGKAFFNVLSYNGKVNSNIYSSVIEEVIDYLPKFVLKLIYRSKKGDKKT